MPIYEYVCEECGERYERIVMSREQLITCPNCASAKNTLQLSVFAARSIGKSSAGSSSSGPSGGGCCGGGGCGCH